jgi:hypothetical protein
MMTQPMKGMAGAVEGLMSGLGKIGLAGLGVQSLIGGVQELGSAIGMGLASEMEQTRAQFMAFTKDAAKTEDILNQVRDEASKTPFQFKEMANAAAGLTPAAKQAGVAMTDLLKDAEVLAASNPAQGLEGAAFALREAVSGDFTSIIERFNLPRSYINKLKEEGVPALEIVRQSMAEMGYDMSLVSNMSQTAQGRWSTLMDTFDSLKMKISEPIFKMLSDGLGEFQKFLDANMGTFSGWADTIGGDIARAAEEVQFYARAILAAFKGEESFGAIFGDFGEVLDEAWSHVVEFATTIQSNIGQTVGFIQQALSGDVGGALTGFLSMMLDTRQQLMAILGHWANEFLEWIGPMIPPFLQEVGRIANGLFQWAVSQVPVLAEQMATWAEEFIAWVEPMIPPLMTELGNMISGVLDWLIANGPKLAKTFLTEWVPAALGWVEKTAEDILPKLLDFVKGVGAWIKDTGVPKLIEFAVKMGQAIVEGLWQGVQNLGGWIGQKIGNWIDSNITQPAKDLLGIHSPSTVFHEIGENVVQGMANGIDATKPVLEASLAGVVGATASAAAQVQAIANAMSNITVGPVPGSTAQGTDANGVPVWRTDDGGWSYENDPSQIDWNQPGPIDTEAQYGVDPSFYPPEVRQAIDEHNQQYAGSFALGGVIPGPIGRPYLATVHGGETVTPPGMGGIDYDQLAGAVLRGLSGARLALDGQGFARLLTTEQGYLRSV